MFIVLPALFHVESAIVLNCFRSVKTWRIAPEILVIKRRLKSPGFGRLPCDIQAGPIAADPVLGCQAGGGLFDIDVERLDGTAPLQSFCKDGHGCQHDHLAVDHKVQTASDVHIDGTHLLIVKSSARQPSCRWMTLRACAMTLSSWELKMKVVACSRLSRRISSSSSSAV